MNCDTGQLDKIYSKEAIDLPKRPVTTTNITKEQQQEDSGTKNSTHIIKEQKTGGFIMSDKKRDYMVSRISYEDDNKAVVLQTALVIPEKELLVQAGYTAAGGAITAAALILFTSVPIASVTGTAVVLAGSFTGAYTYESQYSKKVRTKTAAAREFLLEAVGCPVGWNYIFQILSYNGDEVIDVATPGSIGIVKCIAPDRSNKPKATKLTLQDMCDGMRFGAIQECIKQKIIDNKTGNIDNYKAGCRTETQALFEEWTKIPTNMGKAFYENKIMLCATGAVKIEYSDHDGL